MTTTTNQMRIHLEPTIDIDAFAEGDGTFYIVITDKNIELVITFDILEKMHMKASDWSDRAGLLKLDQLEAAIADLKLELLEASGKVEL